MTNSIYEFSAINNKGEEVSLSSFRNQPMLIVNTASACGFTPQYKGLEELYKQYQKEGLVVLAFPCNQFGKQEKGNDQEIASFCDLTFNISFPLMSKIDVNGDAQHPLYKFLKAKAPGILGTKAIKWNFTKFLISKDGTTIKRYSPKTKPEQLVSEIKSFLK